MDGGGDQVIVFMAEGHSNSGQSVDSEYANGNSTNVDRRGDKKKPPALQSTNTLRKRATLRRLSFSKPKSRNVEFNLPPKINVIDEFDRDQTTIWEEEISNNCNNGGPPMDELLWEQHKPMQGSKSLPTKWKDAKEMMRSKKYGSRKLDMEKLKELSKESPASIWSLKRLMNSLDLLVCLRFRKQLMNLGKLNLRLLVNGKLELLLNASLETLQNAVPRALETGRITKSSFRNWVVRAYFERKALAHSLNDTKTAVQQLHKMASAIVTVVIFVVFLLLMGLATPKVVAFVITQMVVLGVIFHNTCKTIFDCIIFVFVMHPFDIGDRCKVDGVQMIVEEMNILTTVFLRYDMEKIYYPNSALLSKPISNFYRSPEMWDTIPFTIDASTPIESINALKKATQSYIDSKPNHWNSKHSFIVKDIEDLNTMKMALCVQHTINHQNIGERNLRLTDLILELKKNFENLGIKYHLLPQEVHLTQFNINNSPKPTPS
uniref:Mechanosensitive ion channel MscS domain-containing protein n=1 Tax=Chenopodium quinoa TaxID=63459 RepID=A0A803LTQ3_CHEQI